MAENQQTLSSKVSVVTERNIRNYFALFLITGFVSIIIPAQFPNIFSIEISVLLPLVVMIIYIFAIYRKAKGVLANDQIGDSVYYLGFLLTLFALMLTLFDLKGSDALIENIMPKFGVALITTLLGLAVRVFVTAFDVSHEDTQDITEKNLSEASVQLKTQLNIANETFSSAINSLSEELRTTLESHSNQLSIFLKKNNEEFSISAEKIISKINEASNSLSNQSNVLEKSLTNLNSSINSFQNSLSSINQEVSNIGKSFQDLSKVNVSEQLNDLNKQMILFGNTLKDHNNKISGLKDIVDEDMSFLKDQRNQLQLNVKQSQDSIEHIQKNLISLSKVIVDKLKD